MKLAAVVPLGRADASNVLAQIRHQKRAPDVVVIVENGAGVGAAKAAGWTGDVLTCEKRSPGAAKNTALRVLIGSDVTHWATFDDDDLYGPKRLTELCEAFEAGHAVVGKASYFCKLASNQVVLLYPGREQRHVQIVAGPTIASAVWDGMPMFNEDAPWGEDVEWCNDVQKSGRRIWSTSCHHFCYQRHGAEHGHTFPITDEQLLGGARGQVLDIGASGPAALRAINGDRRRVDEALPRKVDWDGDMTGLVVDRGPARMPEPPDHPETAHELHCYDSGGRLVDVDDVAVELHRATGTVEPCDVAHVGMGHYRAIVPPGPAVRVKWLYPRQGITVVKSSRQVLRV